MLGLAIVLAAGPDGDFCALRITWHSPTDGADVQLYRLLPPGGLRAPGARDIWSRIVYGSRAPLLIIFMVAISAAPSASPSALAPVISAAGSIPS